MVALRRRGRRERLRTAAQKITRHAWVESAAGVANAARAALRVRLEMASEDGEVISESGIVFAPETSGRRVTDTRKGRNEMARCVTAWRCAGNGSKRRGCFVVDCGRIFLRWASNSVAESVSTAIVGKCHSLETRAEICSLITVRCGSFGGGGRSVFPRGSSRTAAARITFSVARFL